METTKENLKEMINLLYSRVGVNSNDLNVIIKTLQIIKENNPYDLAEAVDIIDALGGFTPETIHNIARKCDRTYYDIGKKSIQYFKMLIKSTVLDPQVRHVSSMLRVNY